MTYVPFRIVRDPGDMRRISDNLRRDGRRICVVPTMGALHAGHLSLLDIGRAHSDVLILTVFVNPRQFGPSEDYDAYPRKESEDVGKARDHGIDLAFCPAASDIYYEDHETNVAVSELAVPLCGASRAGHFDGVATIVCKLFNITQPHVAVFGKKDYQQLALIKRLVRDLNFGIEILAAEIVREEDGLAMSSRNSYLSADERKQATALSLALAAAQERFSSGVKDARELERVARSVVASAPLAQLEYCEIRDAHSLAAIAHVEAPAVLAMAAVFGGTRLIDNVVLA